MDKARDTLAAGQSVATIRCRRCGHNEADVRITVPAPAAPKPATRAKSPEWEFLGGNDWEADALGWRLAVSEYRGQFRVHACAGDSEDWNVVTKGHPTAEAAKEAADAWVVRQAMAWAGLEPELAPAAAPAPTTAKWPTMCAWRFGDSQERVAELVVAAAEVHRLSHRKHDAWDRLGAAIASLATKDQGGQLVGVRRFAVEFLEERPGCPVTLVRQPLSEWPTWAHGLRAMLYPFGGHPRG